jgi:hypothetical protein
MPYRVHSVIVVEDSGRNENSTSRTNFRYQLTQPVNFYKRGRQYEYYCRVENIRIPISFYNINTNYDTFGWTASVGPDVESFNITNGNYTIDELITEVQVQMNLLDGNTYTITYDEITQKVNIASDGVEDVSTLVGDGWQTLGFDLTETITGASNVDGVNVAYTNTARHLRLHVDNLVSNNIYANDFTTTDGKKQTNLQRISLTIPITQTRNEFQFYDNHHGYMIKLPNMANIGDLNVRLTDANNNPVDLNEVPWGFNMVIYKLKKPKY